MGVQLAANPANWIVGAAITPEEMLGSVHFVMTEGIGVAEKDTIWLTMLAPGRAPVVSVTFIPGRTAAVAADTKVMINQKAIFSGSICGSVGRSCAAHPTGMAPL